MLRPWERVLRTTWRGLSADVWPQSWQRSGMSGGSSVTSRNGTRPAHAPLARGDGQRPRRAATNDDLLTNREREVLHLAARGNSYTESGDRLAISPRTDETHRGNALRKFGLKDQTALVRYAPGRGMAGL